MKISLLFPPQWTAAQPYYALSILNGQLRRAGHQVQIHDLNLAFVEEVLTSPTMRLSYRRLQAERQFLETEAVYRLAIHDRSDQMALLSDKLRAIERYLSNHEELAAQLATQAPEAARHLRTPDVFYNPSLYLQANRVMDEALRLFSLPFYPYEVRWNDFYNPICPFQLAPIREFCTHSRDNPFRRFYEGHIPTILAESPELLAISINSFSQVLPGLTLALMLRDMRDKQHSSIHSQSTTSSQPWFHHRTLQPPKPHICLGGNFFSRLKESLCKTPQFFELFADSVVIGEGDKAITALAYALDVPTFSVEKLHSVPSLLFLDAHEQTVCATPEQPNYAMDDMVIQDLAGFPLDRYLAPERVLCLRASKGCYWGQCTFCDAYHGLQQDQMSIERLIEEIRFLRNTYNIRHFEFIDQCIAPPFMAEICNALQKASLDVRWFCNARTESGFDRALFDNMARAGNTMVMWGVESGSPRLLKLMAKGVSPSKRMSLLQQANDAGLWNFAYVFFGFPSETREEAMSTIELICDHTDIIHSYGRSIFSLGKHSPLMQQPERYGILELVEDQQEFSTNLTFKTASGIQGTQVSEMAQLCTTLCRQAYGEPLWMALRSREALHLYLAHHGKEFVQRFSSQENSPVSAPEFVF